MIRRIIEAIDLFISKFVTSPPVEPPVDPDVPYMRSFNIWRNTGSDKPSWGDDFVYLPPGEHVLDEDAKAGLFTEGRPKVIIGAGPELTMLTLPEQNERRSVLSFLDCPQLVLHNFSLDGNCTERTGWNTPLDVRGCSNIMIGNIDIYNAGNTGFRLSKGGIPGSGNGPDSDVRSSNFSVFNMNVYNTYGPSSITTKSGGAIHGSFQNILCDGWLNQGLGLEGEDLQDEPDITEPGGLITVNEATCINGAGSTTAWGIGITENMKQITIANSRLANIQAANVWAGILVSTSRTQQDTPVDNVTLVDCQFDLEHSPGGAASNDIRVVTGESQVTDLEIIRCSTDVAYVS